MANHVVKPDDEGFTLFELLIVSIILGILFAIVMFSVTGANRTSLVNACTVDLRSVNASVVAYSSDYPNSSTDLTNNSGLYPGTSSTLISNGYLAALDASTGYRLTLLVTSVTPTNPSAPAYSWKVRVTSGSNSEDWDPQLGDPKGLCSRVIS